MARSSTTRRIAASPSLPPKRLPLHCIFGRSCGTGLFVGCQDDFRGLPAFRASFTLPPMSDRLSELLRQRALVQEHLAWLDRQIADASMAVLPPLSGSGVAPQ